MDEKYSLNKYLQDSIRKNWDLMAMRDDLDGEALLFSDVARLVAKMHIAFEKAGIEPGDRIAICGKNSANWDAAFIGIVTYGAVVVPILHDFHPDNIQYLIDHSESKLAFCDADIWDNLEPEKMPKLIAALRMSDYHTLLTRSKAYDHVRDHINELFGKKYPKDFTRDDVVYRQDKPEDLVIINYTSGSTGNSKGVMIPMRAVESNLRYAVEHLEFLHPGDGLVCMLPLAHMYGLMFDMLHCFIKGVCVTYLTRRPSPAIILKAFAAVRPKLIVAVPLIIEKIVKGKILPQLQKPIMKVALSIPFLNKKIYATVKKKLIDAFGGQLEELIIGGAGLNREVETLLRKIKFPYTVGYGMTECAPLLAYAPWDIQKMGSCGQLVDRMEAKIDSPDPANVPGVLFVKGANVMLGYYKNPEATEAVLQPDGWLNTGDICTIDKDGYIFIKGRDKTMLLGPSGQNIYPEEIEQVLSQLPYVAECLVVQDPQNQKLIALIYPDPEQAEKDGLDAAAIAKQMEENIKTANAEMPAYSRLSEARIMDKEFEKTPKRSIKRYLYKA